MHMGLFQAWKLKVYLPYIFQRSVFHKSQLSTLLSLCVLVVSPFPLHYVKVTHPPLLEH